MKKKTGDTPSVTLKFESNLSWILQKFDKILNRHVGNQILKFLLPVPATENIYLHLQLRERLFATLRLCDFGIPSDEYFGAPRFTWLGLMQCSGIPIFDSIRFRI